MRMPQQRLETDEDSSLDETRKMEAELSILTEQQYEALQKASYLRMSEAEREAIDQRRVRIGELAEWLAKFRPKTQIGELAEWLAKFRPKTQDVA